MFSHLEELEIYLAVGSTDMRNSIAGLSYLVEQKIQRNPRDRQLYLFCNRRRNRLKILHYDVNGYWLYYKQLEMGHFSWPKQGAKAVLELSVKELEWLLHGTHLVDQKSVKNEEKVQRY